MTEIIRSVILGVIQGLTEFLPVSSSAHLNIFPWMFTWTMTDSFDLALHAGTLLAILIYFFKDWIALVVGGWNQVVNKKKTTNGKLFWFIVFGTIPAGLIGALIEKLLDPLLENKIKLEMGLIAAALIIMGIILYLVDNKAKTTTSLASLKFKPAFLIGFSQALAAAFPGVSRSGITMTVSRAYGLDRESAAKFSFLLSAPMVAGALLVGILGGEIVLDWAFFFGTVASFISGLLVIKFLLNFLKKGTYKIFAAYRVLIGIVIIVLLFVK